MRDPEASPPFKPQSDIRCNRFATSPRLTIYTNRRGRDKVPDRSWRGCREVGDWLGTSLRPNQSQPGFCACTKTWLRLIWSQTGPGKVADQSPISRRLVADRSPTNFVRIGAWLSLKLVGDWSAIGRRLVGDRSATYRGPLRDLTATSRGPWGMSYTKDGWWGRKANLLSLTQTLLILKQDGQQ